MNVSVVIPAHDTERYVAAAIESALTQSHPPLEVIVIDDGSSDGTAAIAESFDPSVRLETVDHAGAGAARNRGIELARGDAIGFLDSDDVWRPDKLEHQVARIDDHDLVFGMLDEFVSPELSGPDAASLRARPGLHPGHVASALLARRSAFDRVGPFVTHLEVGEFVDWIARAKAAGLREVTVPHHVVSRRVHGRNSTLRHRASLPDLARVLKASLDRQRLEGVA